MRQWERDGARQVEVTFLFLKLGSFISRNVLHYGPTPTGHATTSAGDSQEYEMIRDPGRKAEVHQNLVSILFWTL